MADETEFTSDDVAESLNIETSTEDGDEGNGESTEDRAELDDQSSDEDSDPARDGDDEEGDEADPETSSEGEGKGDGEEGEDGDGEGGDGEDGEVALTPEHEVGARLSTFLTERLPPERFEEGMVNFTKSLNIVADQMSGNHEGYWKGLMPSLEQSAVDNPDMFLDTLAPLYQKVLEGTGRVLNAENRRSVDNMEMSEEVALKMQVNDHKLTESQKRNEFFKNREGQDRESRDMEQHNQETILAVRDTIAALSKDHPQATWIGDHIAEELKDFVPKDAKEAKMVIENAFYTRLHAEPLAKNKSGRGKKNPIRSNRSSTPSKPANNPDVEFSAEEIAASLGQ